MSSAVRRLPFLCVLLAILLFIALFTFLQFQLYAAFRMGLRDLGLYQQALESVLRGEPLLVREGYPANTAVSSLFYGGWDQRSIFSERVYLLLPLFLAVYALFRTPHSLFVLNAIVVALAAVPLFLLARRRIGSEWLAAVVAILFLLHPAVQVATLGSYIYGMHPDNFAPLFLFALLYGAELRRPRAFWLMALLALATAETIALTMVSLGVYLAIVQPGWRRHSLVLIVAAIAAWSVSSLLIIPLAGGGRSPYYLAALQSWLAALEHPELFQPIAQALLDLGLAVLIPLGMLPLLGGIVWIIVLPELLAGIAALSVGYTLPLEYGSWHAWAYMLAAFLGLINVLVFARRRYGQRAARLLVLILVPAAAAGIVLFGPFPFSRNVWPTVYDVDVAKAALIAQVQSEIPYDARLSVEFFLGSHFAGRPNVYWFPANWREADYVLVDSAPWAWWSEDDARSLSKVQRSAYVQQVRQEGKVYLFRHQPLPAIQQPLSESFANGIELNGYTVEPRTLAAGTPVTLTLFWRARQAIPQDLTVFVHVVGAEGKVVTQRDSQPDNGAYSTSQWPAGEQIWDRRVIPLPANTASGSYEFEIGLYDAATGRRSELVTGQDHLRLGSLTVRPQ